ncbi:MAG TPA: peptide-methionine (S)-S-oxide reductase MsrA [Candidatus Paceibacterota bacterium]|nr:peptide-methionine (S)-S-oxide reductase MsrA [Candidatus Paceibacterota bacterium]
MASVQFQTAVFGGGCFWCGEAVFQRLKGVQSVTSGYAGGSMENPSYQQVSSGQTGHAEVVKVEYNPAVLSYDTLLSVFFATHDPTTMNRQGSDIGPQYRSAIFYTSEEQKMEAEKFMQKLADDKVFKAPIVTELKPLEAFYEADASHKDYYNRNKEAPYCQVVIDPKIQKLQEKYAHLLK